MQKISVLIFFFLYGIQPLPLLDFELDWGLHAQLLEQFPRKHFLRERKRCTTIRRFAGSDKMSVKTHKRKRLVRKFLYN